MTPRHSPAWCLVPWPGHPRLSLASKAVLFCLLLVFSSPARTAEPNPLQPVDTSSPRATLQSFIENTDAIYQRLLELVRSYSASGRLYPTAQDRRILREIFAIAPRAVEPLDISGISPVLRKTVAVERVLQLREILDRIKLPSLDEVPDQDAMTRAGSKKWRLPGTEIDFVLIPDGPRAGEYLVSAATVDRLPEFYEQVKDLPYKPGLARQVMDAYQTLSSGNVRTVYEAYLSSPLGLGFIIPVRWMLSLPHWAKTDLAGVQAWQWLGLSLGLFLSALVIFASNRLAARLSRRNEDGSGPGWQALPVPLAIVFVCGLLLQIWCALFRIGGMPRVIIAFVQTTALFLSAAWLCIVGSIILGELLVSSEHVTRSSLDNQLVRLGMRLVGVVAAIAFLIQGADDLGFPAYSVLAGLGVGGLAVALAARDSIANLLGSLLIMLEKPFRIGHYIKLSGTEGTVEDVGFRSTRIRTLDNSLISIPNNAVVNTTVENLSLRAMRRQRFFVQITYDTTREKMEEMVSGIRQLILEHPLTNKSNVQVRFNNMGESSLDILVMFYFNIDDYSVELREREAILLQVMDLAKDLGVEFAFPTRTLHVETSLPSARTADADAFRWSAS